MCTTKYTEDKNMWTQGTIGVKDENGRISKLMLKQDDRVVYNYDRGEDVEPQTTEAEMAVAILIHEYN